MDESRDIWDSISESTVITTWLKLARLISEGFLCSEFFESEKSVNVFGRKGNGVISDDLSMNLGQSATGLRTTALLDQKLLHKYSLSLSSAIKQHVGLVVNFHELEKPFDQPVLIPDFPGCFQMVATNIQEVVDFNIIAHKIAESSLVPGIVWSKATDLPATLDFPSKEELKTFLGSPDDQIECPTPAQQMLFGKSRRRIPNWFNLDIPITSGYLKDSHAQSAASAAQHQFFFNHLSDILPEAFHDFAKLTGRQYHQVSRHQDEKADFLIITAGSIHNSVVEAIDKVKQEGKKKVGCVNLNVLNPFPFDEMRELISRKKAVTILESGDFEKPGERSFLLSMMKNVIGSLEKKAPETYSGLYNNTLTGSDLSAIIENMMPKGKGQRNFYAGIEFSRPVSLSPKHEILLEHIDRLYPGISNHSISGIHNEEQLTTHSRQTDLPFIIRQFKDEGPPFSKVSRFYNDTAFFYQNGVEKSMVADPFQALDAVPPATANFANSSGHRDNVPVFNPINCTGCGDCFVACPHSAIPSMALDLESLLKGYMQIAVNQGLTVSKLTPIIKNLAIQSTRKIESLNGEINIVSDFLPDAFEDLIEKMGVEGEKKKDLEKDFKNVLNIAADFNLSSTDTFFKKQQALKRGSGEMFSLAIDPVACTGCGICASVCKEDALSMKSSSEENVLNIQKQYKLWEQLPDTGSDTISRLIREKEYNPFAAILLSRNFYTSISGGDENELGSKDKAPMHLITSVVESLRQPQVYNQVETLNQLISDLSENIHLMMSNALPRENFEPLSEVISESDSEKLPFEAIISELGAKEHLHLLDKSELNRKIDLFNDLKYLVWQLKEGPTGTGRSRFGMVMSGLHDFPWANVYPYNVFSSPLSVQNEDQAPEFIEGIYKGLVRHTLDNIKLIRRAKLEVRNKYTPEVHDEQIASIGFEELDEEEKMLMPTLLLVGKRNAFSLKQITNLFSTGLPLKIMILEEELLPGMVASQQGPGITDLLSAAMLHGAYLLQGSTESPGHLFDGLVDGLQFSGPAAFYIHSPNHKRDHENHDDQVRAIDSRSFPLVKFKTSDFPATMSNALSLADNPSEFEDWHNVIKASTDENGQGEFKYTVTYADWIFCQSEWKDKFRKLNEDDESPISIDNFLKLEPDKRSHYTPFIETFESGGSGEKRVVPDLIIKAAERAQGQWRLLREMAGMHTSFPEKLKDELEKEFSKKYEDSVLKIKKEFEEKYREKENEIMDEVKKKLKDKLITLSGKKKED